MSLISLSGVSLRFDNKILLDGASLNIAEGDTIALVGRNGCGKTSMLKIIAGVYESDSGLVERVKGVKVAYMPQDVPMDLSGSIYDVVSEGLGEAGAELRKYRRLLREVERGCSKETQDEFDRLVHVLDEKNFWGADVEILSVIERMELNPDLDVGSVSAGLKRRALLGRELAGNPGVLLLDEPTNHLDIDSVVWLEKFLKTCSKTIVFVSHDRAFIQNLATRIVEIDRGNLISFDCDFKTFERRRDDLLRAQERNEAVFDKKLLQEEAWLRQGIKARRTRNEGRVKELMRLRKIRSERRERLGTADMRIQEASASGQRVMDVKNISLSFGENAIIKNFSTTIYRGDKIGIIGRNGIGKTTLLNVLLGNLKPDSGEVSYGTRLQIAYFDQLRKNLNPSMRPFDFVGDGADFVTVNGARQNVMGYLQNFLFEPEQICGEIAMLSGGEKNRLMLAKLFASPANVLVLDEPTNDLDMQTIELLENSLVTFPGTILMVSHDRAFLNNIVTGVFCFGDGGNIVELVGGYDEWERYRLQTAEPERGSQKSKTVQAVPQKKRSKFTNKEREEFERLPKQIEALEAELSELEAKLSDSEYVVSHFDELAKINERMAEIRLEDERLFERWSELEERRLEMES